MRIVVVSYAQAVFRKLSIRMEIEAKVADVSSTRDACSAVLRHQDKCLNEAWKSK